MNGETIQVTQHNTPLEDIAASLSQRLMRSGAAPMTGPIKLADGSAAAPGMAFGSAAGTGIYKTSNGVGVSVGGAQVAEFVTDGMVKGVRYIGELIPYTGTTAQALTVLPYGQTLNRADYPDLWDFAQDEITASNSGYNNGNGSTTFGIPDMRGRVPAGWDSMGGTAASRLTTAGSGVDGATLGAVGGTEAETLLATQIPSHTHAATVTDPGHTHPLSWSGAHGIKSGGSGGQAGGTDFTNPDLPANTSSNITGITVSNANTGGGGAHNNTQPTFVCNFLLFAGA